jgi:hypothetical protein
MNETMNRATRRAAGMKKPSIKITNRIDVVPMEHIESFWKYEIASEGKWASDVPVMVLQPEIDRGPADRIWFDRTLERLWETRRRKGTIPMVIGGAHQMAIDVGLVDIVVFFQMPGGVVPSQEEHFDQMLIENLRHVELACSGAFHDQMILATAFHRFHSNGSRLFHYHNVIFGLRQEIRDGMDLLGPLDMDPLVKALAKGGPLNIIGRIRQ